MNASQTRIDEIADGIYRISTPVPPSPALPAGFTCNQFLIVDDDAPSIGSMPPMSRTVGMPGFLAETCMHGASYRGNAAALLRALGQSLSDSPR